MALLGVVKGFTKTIGNAFKSPEGLLSAAAIGGAAFFGGPVGAMAMAKTIGAAGLAFSAVGAITGNEDLAKLGGNMGTVALAGGGIAAGASAFKGGIAGLQADFSEAWKRGWTSPLTPTGDAAGAAIGVPAGPSPTGGEVQPLQAPVRGAPAGAPPPNMSVAPNMTPNPAIIQPSTMGNVVDPTTRTAFEFGAGPTDALSRTTPGKGGIVGAFDRLPDYGKTAVAVGGVQALSSIPQGYYAGELQRQQYEVEQERLRQEEEKIRNRATAGPRFRGNNVIQPRVGTSLPGAPLMPV